MTRDEAVKIWRDTLHPANCPKWSSDQWAEKAIDAYAMLGMLKLDDTAPRPRQFVLAYQGLLHGPFETADEASRFAKRGGFSCGPWSIQGIQRAMSNEQMDAADAKRASAAA